MTQKVLVVDDESLARQRLIKMFETIDGFEVIDEAANGEIAIDKLMRMEPDVVLLDIRMPGIDGMQVAKAIEEKNLKTHVIFTTAYDEYALDAFDVQAEGYLLKPINKEKLEKALSKFVEKIEGEEGRNHLSASSRGNIELIPLDSVRILQAEHKYVTVYHTGGESILDESLKALETQFPERFKRVHRNALVSVDHVLAMGKNPEGQYALTIADVDIKPVVSRRLVSEVRNWMKQL